MLLNAVALTPLMERFEAEHGTLTALLLFVGRMSLASCSHGLRVLLTSQFLALSTFPAAIYVLIEKYILYSNTAVVGARLDTFGYNTVGPS